MHWSVVQPDSGDLTVPEELLQAEFDIEGGREYLHGFSSALNQEIFFFHTVAGLLNKVNYNNSKLNSQDAYLSHHLEEQVSFLLGLNWHI